MSEQVEHLGPWAFKTNQQEGVHYMAVCRLLHCPRAGGNLHSIIFGRTDLRISGSGAKLDAEYNFEVRLPLAPQKPNQNSKKLISDPQEKVDFCLSASNMECRGSSETRFDRRILSESLISGGKRPFKVRE